MMSSKPLSMMYYEMAAYNNYVPFYGLGIGKRFTTLYSIHGYCTYQSCFTVVKKSRQILYV